MQGLLKMSGMIDGMNERIGRATIWLILIVVIISAGNAVSRFALNISSNAMLEVQWYMFSAVFMFCSGYVLNKNEHIRIDVVTGRFSARTQNWIDVFGILVFLLPMAPIGFALLILQGISELIKRVAFLTGAGPNSLDKEAGPSAEQELAEAIKKHQVAPQVVSYVEANHEMVDQPKQGDRK